MMKSGIILAGGLGTRLLPLTTLFNKHMVPVYNKFVIDYPLNTMHMIGVTNLTIVLGGNHFGQVVSHIKDGSHLGFNISYCYQDKPIGIAQAINLCERLIPTDEQFVVLLGDNIFEEPIELSKSNGAQVILYKHQELNRFGVASLRNDKIEKIEEKPKIIDNSYDNYAITGCYIFDHNFFKYFKQISPSARGEYEITDIIKLYNENDLLSYSFAYGLWHDCGTHESINFINNYFYNKDK